MSRSRSLGIPVLTMSVALREGKSESLTMYDNDIPAEVVRRFVTAHKLPNKSEVQLLDQIGVQISSMIESQPSTLNTPSKVHYSEPKVKELMQTRMSNASLGSEIGQRLYERGIDWKKRVEHERETQKLLQEKSGKNHSFKPEINRKSEYLVRKSYFTYKEERRTKETEQLLSEKASREFESCTFSPNINTNPNLTNGNRFNLLYEEAKLRENRKIVMAETFKKFEFSFTPHINPGSKDTRTQVFTRLCTPKASSAKPEDLVDPKTGQEFFKPIIKRTKSKKWSGIGTHSMRCLNKKTESSKILEDKMEMAAKIFRARQNLREYWPTLCEKYANL